MTEDVAGETARAGQGGRRLDSWKEIASYLGRDIRTVQRWEAREGLPVHRQQHLKLGSVFALTAELDAWRESKDSRAPEPLPPDPAGSPPDEARRFRRFALPAAAAAVLLAAAIPLVSLQITEPTARSALAL